MIRNLLIPLACAATFATLLASAAFADPITPAPGEVASSPAGARPPGQTKIAACGIEWKQAKVNDGVKQAGWPAYWSACSKRRAADFPSKKAAASAPAKL